MKKILLVMSIFLLCSCTSNKNIELKTYNNLVKELREKEETITTEELNISVEVEKLEEIYNYRVLIDKPEFNISDVVALVITDEEELYPSIGIFDDKISLTKESKEKGIKLSGYTNNKDIKFKVYISFTKDNKEYKNYYVIDNVTYLGI